MNAAYSQEIERLYLQMYDKLFSYAKSSLRSDSLAEEAVQETFGIACSKPEALCASENPEGWLVKTLKYVLSNMARSRKTVNQLLTDYIGAGQGADGVGGSAQLRAAVRGYCGNGGIPASQGNGH